jgi:hypothetical protein
MMIWKVLGPQSKPFIFFLNSKWAQKARVLNYTVLRKFTNYKYSSLLGPIVSYEENEVL